jgi:transposase-like protein
MSLDQIAQCPKCRHDMIYVAALPYPNAPNMLKTTFVCRACNRTWNYSLAPEMAARYAAFAPTEAAS